MINVINSFIRGKLKSGLFLAAVCVCLYIVQGLKIKRTHRMEENAERTRECQNMLKEMQIANAVQMMASVQFRKLENVKKS